MSEVPTQPTQPGATPEPAPETTAEPAAKPKRPGLRGWVRGLLVGALLIVGVVALGVSWVERQLGPVAETGSVRDRAQAFEVAPGWGAAQVAGALEDAGLVRNARVFSVYLQLENLDRSVGEGLYTLSPSLSVPELARRLARGGRPRVTSAVIPEGFRTAQVVNRLKTKLGVDIGPLVRRPGALRPAFVPVGAGLEGYLFPARYDFPVGSSPEDAVQQMLRRFERELTPGVRQNLKTLGLSVQAWVTLASMVQAEAGSYAEMPVIAGVFLNRLDRKMLLQSDPTVAYGLGKRLPELDAVAGDLRRDTPWNTYTRAGLPRTPIGNPGANALLVIFQAQRVNAEGQPYLYFLHAPGGEFRPNLTLEGHNRDVATYLRGTP